MKDLCSWKELLFAPNRIHFVKAISALEKQFASLFRDAGLDCIYNMSIETADGTKFVRFCARGDKELIPLYLAKSYIPKDVLNESSVDEDQRVICWEILQAESVVKFRSKSSHRLTSSDDLLQLCHTVTEEGLKSGLVVSVNCSITVASGVISASNDDGEFNKRVLKAQSFLSTNNINLFAEDAELLSLQRRLPCYILSHQGSRLNFDCLSLFFKYQQAKQTIIFGFRPKKTSLISPFELAKNMERCSPATRYVS